MKWGIAGMVVVIVVIIIIIIFIIGSTALTGPWPPHENATGDLYPVHLPAKFYNPVSLPLPLPRRSILILVGRILTDLQGLPTDIFLDNPFPSIRKTRPTHLSLLDFVTVTIFGSS